MRLALAAAVAGLCACGGTSGEVLSLRPFGGDGGTAGGPYAGGLLFRSDWSTAQGSTPQALSDDGRWDTLGCESQLVTLASVVPAASAGWSLTPHVLRFAQRGGCGGLEVTRAIPVGRDFFVRFYVRGEPGSGAGLGLGLATDAAAGGLWDHYDVGAENRLKFAFGGAAHPTNAWGPVAPLRYSEWYRIELWVHFVTADGVEIWPRVFDASGALVADATTLYAGADAMAQSLEAFWRSGSLHRLADLDAARRLWLGTLGGGSDSCAASCAYWYYASVEVRSDGWPGPAR